MARIRLAVIGVGLMGAKHAALVRAHADCTLVGLADPDPARQTVADTLAVPFYATAAELLQRQRPAGVIVATPNAQHAPVALACLAQGVPVLIEKPVADTLAQAERIVVAARTAGVATLVGHHRRHNPLVQRTRALVRGGALGRLIGVSALWALLKPDAYFAVAWRRERPGGGPLLINLIHELDSLRFICGEVSEVAAHTSSAVRGLAVEDSLNLALTFASGALGTILASDAAAAPWSYEATTGENPAYCRTGENCYHFLGTAGALAFPRMELWQYPAGAPRGWQHPLARETVAVPPADPLCVQLAHFCRVIRGEAAPLVDAAEGTRSLALALAIHEAAARGTPVRLPVPPAAPAAD